MEGTEETPGGHPRKLLRPLDSGHFVVAEADASDKDIETIRNEGGVEIWEFRDRNEVFQGGMVNGFLQGCTERP